MSTSPFVTATCERNFLKCPTCGTNQPRERFVRGALGHAVQALRQTFWPRSAPNGGGSTWARRPMNLQELELVARALAKAVEVVSQFADSDSIPDPVRVLAEVDDDEEMAELALAWIAEAKDELERREQLVDDELRRRDLSR